MTGGGGGREGGGVMSGHESIRKKSLSLHFCLISCVDLVLDEKTSSTPNSVTEQTPLKAIVGISISWLPLCFRDK